MEQAQWAGVFTAITTPFTENLDVDHAFLGDHANWLIENGCAGIVALGSLGEAATLQFEEKVAIIATLR
jgi:4-hydroxy-tetrahydrodipicolinate synthase